MCWANYVYHRITLTAQLNLGLPLAPPPQFSKFIETFDTVPYVPKFSHRGRVRHLKVPCVTLYLDTQTSWPIHLNYTVLYLSKMISFHF